MTKMRTLSIARSLRTAYVPPTSLACQAHEEYGQSERGNGGSSPHNTKRILTTLSIARLSNCRHLQRSPLLRLVCFFLTNSPG
ncbi:uncharacterized protein BDV17DRAFT_270384 [Aspergillus undulatus]|uniref:uncharacterized protein n=1 Tax=Aspergillus undulatus TaxID=1810928 RepID=UPI003CCC9BBE